MRTGIQRNQTRFHHRSIPFHSQRIELQLHGEAQRTVVQHLLRLVAPRIDNGIIHHQCRHSGSQCWAYCIAVHAITVVYMIGECAYQLIGCLRVCLAQFINLLPGVCIQFLGIHVFQYRCSSASLREQVVAETAFTLPAMQDRRHGSLPSRSPRPCRPDVRDTAAHKPLPPHRREYRPGRYMQPMHWRLP